MRVEVIAKTEGMEKLISSVGKLCYSKVGVNEIRDNMTEEDVDKFLSKIMSIGHQSILEHGVITFAIEGVSRALANQLVRHRIASFTQQSQRYVEMESPDFIKPKTIDSFEKEKVYATILIDIKEAYKELVRLGVPKEDARYVLPNAVETKIAVTMNCRSLLNFFQLRCCKTAQWEIRDLANEMLKECKKVAPTIFKLAGANCKECKELNTCRKPESKPLNKSKMTLEIGKKYKVREDLKITEGNDVVEGMLEFRGEYLTIASTSTWTDGTLLYNVEEDNANEYSWYDYCFEL